MLLKMVFFRNNYPKLSCGKKDSVFGTIEPKEYELDVFFGLSKEMLESKSHFLVSRKV